MTSNMSDRVLRFIPTEERFVSYPSPTRVTWLREGADKDRAKAQSARQQR